MKIYTLILRVPKYEFCFVRIVLKNHVIRLIANNLHFLIAMFYYLFIYLLKT